MPRFITNEFQCYVRDVTVAMMMDVYYVALQLTVESVRPCTTVPIKSHKGTSMSKFVGIEGLTFEGECYLTLIESGVQGFRVDIIGPYR